MAAATTTNQLPLLKRLWGTKVAEPFYKASRFFQLIKKDTNFGGEGRYVNVTVAPTAGGSASFPDAVASQDATVEKRFFVTHRKEYQVFTLQGDLIARSHGNANAMVESLRQQADKARYAMARATARRAWGNGGGAIGQITSGLSLAGTTLTFRSALDIAALDVGMQLEFASDDGSSSSPAGRRGAPDRLTVTAIDRSAQSATVSAALNTVSSITDADYVFRRGDYSLAMSGARGWNPISAPSGGDSFMGLDRSASDVVRLSGGRITGGGKPKEETIQDATAEAMALSIDPKEMFVDPYAFRDIAKELGSKKEFQGDAKTGAVGFSYLEVYAATGVLKIIAEVDVPQGYFWMFDTSQWTARSAGEWPRMLNEDNVGKLLRLSDDDAYQGRLGAYGNFFHENPGNAIIGSW